MQSIFELELEIIDHRSWHTRFESTVINEVYAKGFLKKDVDVETHIEIIASKVKDAIRQEVSLVFVCFFVLFLSTNENKNVNWNNQN